MLGYVYKNGYRNCSLYLEVILSDWNWMKIVVFVNRSLVIMLGFYK